MNNEIVRDESWKNKTLLVGLLLVALTGLGAAYILVQRGSQMDSPPKLTAGEGLKLSLLLLGLIRQVGSVFE